MNSLGATVALLRAENGWTQQELARRISRVGPIVVRYQNVQQLEAKPHMRPRYLPQLAVAFGKSVEDLQGWEPGMPAFGPNGSDSVSEAPPSPYGDLALSTDEEALLAHYRACNKRAREALRILAEASRGAV